MGGAVSSGRSNDDLIDNLLEADYIKTSLIERVFRAVDRAEYFLSEARGNAYKDLAWKKGNLHISAPCIYSEVMEALDLAPGLSFLNLGSGTGYLSTMVGLILGTNGINHGIEIHEDVIEYAYKKLEDFKKYSGAIDEYDFCEPKFIQGNCLGFTSESTVLYDRLYCGASCPEEFQQYMQNMIKIGGILVMPLNDRLLQIKRLTEFEWKSRSLLPVSFASLIVPPEGFQDFIKPIEVDPLPLQMLCRSVVRNILRKGIEKEHPPVKNTPLIKVPKKKRTLRRMVVPLLDELDSSDDERERLSRRVRLGGERNRDAGRAVFRREDDRIFSLLLGMGMRRGSEAYRSRTNPSLNDRDDRTGKQANNMETDEQDTEDSVNNNGQPTSQQVQAIIEHHENQEDLNDSNVNNAYLNEEGAIEQISDVIEECLDMLRQDAVEGDDQRDSTGINENIDMESKADDDNQCSVNSNQSGLESASTTKPSTSNANSKKSGKREKSDSGLGDEIIEAQESSDEDQMQLDAISSSDEDCTVEKRFKRGTITNPQIRKFRRIDMCRHFIDSSSDTEEDIAGTGNELRMYESLYTQYMTEKIQELPLPSILKKYLNYYRDINIKLGE